MTPQPSAPNAFLVRARTIGANAVRTGWTPPFLAERPRALRIAWRTLILAILALFLLWLLLYLTKGRFLKEPFEGIASTMAEREVRVEGDFQLYFDPVTIKFLAEDLSSANADWTKSEVPLFAARRFDSRIAPFRLLFGETVFKQLNLEDGHADLRWDGAHQRNNWTFGSDDGEPLSLPQIRKARISGTRIDYADPLLALLANIGIDTVKADRKGFEDAIRFSGGGSLRRRAFTLNGSLLSPDETLAGGRNRIALDARAGGTRLSLSGTLPSASQIDGGRFDVKASGPNLAFLFDFLGVAVPETRQYRLSSDLAYADEAWRFTGMSGVIGESDIAGTMTITMPENRLMIDADLASKSVDIIDIGPVIGYNPERLDAMGGAGAITRVNGAPRLLPDAPLRYEAVQRFDAHIDYRAGTIRNDHVPVSDIALTLDLDHGNLQLSPLTLSLAGGKLAADIGIDARQRPVRTLYDIRLSPTPMGRLLAGFGVSESGTTGTLAGRIRLNGIGESLRESLSTSHGRIAMVIPKGTMWTRNAQLAELDIGVFIQKMFEDKLEKPVEINCGLVAFTVRDGVAAADPVLIDTSKNVILGRGGFSFRTEVIDMAVRADGKKFSLFSGQSPVGIDGYFAEPGIDPISGDLLARAGAGIGLGVIASPLASVVAFVDIGDAKAADCGPVLSGARAAAQRTRGGKPRDDFGNGTPAKSEDGSATDEQKKEQRDKFLRGR
ncbi:MAG: AsmA family protein [Blastomonas sp.]